MRGIGVNGLVKGEVGWVVVVGLVERRLGGWVGLCEAANEFLQVAFALGGRDGRARTIVVVERLEGVNGQSLIKECNPSCLGI